jgi:hypothetical protein
MVDVMVKSVAPRTTLYTDYPVVLNVGVEMQYPEIRLPVIIAIYLVLDILTILVIPPSKVSGLMDRWRNWLY